MTKLFTGRNVNIEVIRAMNEELETALNNKFETLGQNDQNLEEINKIITKTIIETAIEVGGKAIKQVRGELSQYTKDLIKNAMKVTSSKDEIEFVQVSKLISYARQSDVRK